MPGAGDKGHLVSTSCNQKQRPPGTLQVLFQRSHRSCVVGSLWENRLGTSQ